MAILKILTDTNPRLRKISKEVDSVTPKIQTLLNDMVETMRKHQGVGLAAPQVGILKRIVVIETTPDEVHKFINPVIIESAGEQVGDEGCLSVPLKSGIVNRPNYVKVKALNENGEEIIVEGTELFARCVCHELDHLEGILYTDIANKITTYDEDGNEILVEEKK